MKNLAKLDKTNVYKTISQFPHQINKGLELKKVPEPLKQKQFKKALICGMGGSALAGAFLKDMFPGLLGVHRNYDLPQNLDKNTLVVCVSYSGNTEETISAYLKAQKLKFPTMVISTNGKLALLAKKDKVPFWEIKSKGIEPRFSILEQISLLIQLLSQTGLIPKQNLRQSAKIITPLISQKGKEMAASLKKKIILIYTSASFKTLAYFWKIAFNENAKIPAFWNVFPELNHNEMMQWKAWPKPQEFLILLLEQKGMNPRIKKRMEISSCLFQRKGLGVKKIKLEGSNPLETIFYGIVLGSWVSYYLALSYKIDPADPDIREKFKLQLQQAKS